MDVTNQPHVPPSNSRMAVESLTSGLVEYSGLGLMIVPATFDASPYWQMTSLAVGLVLYSSGKAFSHMGIIDFIDRTYSLRRDRITDRLEDI